MATHGGRYDFDDGGTYLGTWEEGKAHGYGSCSGPKGLGEFAGLWQAGFESSGVYSWPSGNSFEGQWQNGKRHGLGMETKGKWIYRGEWSMGFKGRHGVRQAQGTGAKYEGGYTSGIQEGYGVETYADGGYYSGQFNRGCRHGFGVRKSPPFSVLAQFLKDKTIRASLTSLRSIEETEEIVKQREKHLEEVHGGFVLMNIQPSQMVLDAHQLLARKARKAAGEAGSFSLSRRPLFARLRKQHSVSDVRGCKDFKTASVRSAVSAHENDAVLIENNLQKRPLKPQHNHGHYVPSANHKPQMDQTLEPDSYVDPNVVEIYSGQWKADKRTGYGVCERSDGLKFEGELFNNMRHGFGMTTFANGMQECGRYKNNVLTEWSDAGRSRLVLFGRGSKLRDKVDEAVKQARGAAQMAVQISDVARSIQIMARQKADAADQAANKARLDKEIAKKKAAEFMLIYPDKRGAKSKDKFSLGVQAALSSVMGCALSPGEEGKLYSSPRSRPSFANRNPIGSQSAVLSLTGSDDPQVATCLSLSTLLGNAHDASDEQALQNEECERQNSSSAVVNDLFSHYSVKESVSMSSCTSAAAVSTRSRTTVSNSSTTVITADSPTSPSLSNGTAKHDQSAATRRASYATSPHLANGGLNARTNKLLNQVSKLAQQTEESDMEQDREVAVSANKCNSAVSGSSPLNKQRMETSGSAAVEKRRSIPDLHTCESLKQHVMPREQAYRLGHARRQEMLQERLLNGEVIVIRVGLFKRWFLRHLVIFVAFFLNLALIFWLASLLPPDDSQRSDLSDVNNAVPRDDG